MSDVEVDVIGERTEDEGDFSAVSVEPFPSLGQRWV